MPAEQATAAQKAPILSDSALFDSLDLTLPGLASVKAAVDSGDMQAARHALAEYLRARTNVKWDLPTEPSDRTQAQSDRQAADNAVAGKVVVVNISHQFPGGEIEWHYNATDHDPKLPHDNEWQWQLNRMNWWYSLGAAYQATHDEKYANAFAKQLRSWRDQCPDPGNVKQAPGSAWRTIETGIRMRGSWPTAFFTFLHSPALTDDDLVDYLKLCIEQARYLREHPTGGNWVTMEMSGLYTVGAVFPECKESKDWRDSAAARLYKEETAQFMPDGAQVELSPGYHNVALDNILRIAQVARMTGHADELPAGYVDGIEKAYDYDLGMMTPNRNLPRFNDSWDFPIRNSMQAAYRLYPKRTDFEWFATDGKSGKAPAVLSRAFPWAGYFVMRSSWARDANYLCFDAGPLGNAHIHQDKLTLTVYPYGRRLLFNSGGGMYERSKWRAYATDTFSKNTILVDGEPQRRTEKDPDGRSGQSQADSHWKSTPQIDFAQGVYADSYGKAGHKPATQRRQVLFIKPDIFIVSDTLTSLDGAPHSYQARWNLLSTDTSVDEKTHAVVTKDLGLPNLAVVPLLTEGLTIRAVSAQTSPELLGWSVQRAMPHAIPATTVVQERSGPGIQHFLTLLLPLHPGEANPVKSIASHDGSSSADFSLADGRSYGVMFDKDGQLIVVNNATKK